MTMTQGFYEQLGVSSTASLDEIRAAYQRLVTSQMRRRKKVTEEGGDTSSLDLARAQADEAWEVLSDQGRRQRYDAMLSLADTPIADAHSLWEETSGAIIEPAAATAAALLQASTTLHIGRLPNAEAHAKRGAQHHAPVVEPESNGPSVGHEEAMSTQVPDVSDFPSEPGSVATGSLYELPHRGDMPSLAVVDGSPDASPVLMMPAPVSRESAISAEDVVRLINEHGYSGAMLKAVREARSIALQDMADTTRISVRYLAAIEQDEHEVLPSATFVRGYIREMARVLAIDEDSTVSGYMSRYER